MTLYCSGCAEGAYSSVFPSRWSSRSTGPILAAAGSGGLIGWRVPTWYREPQTVPVDYKQWKVRATHAVPPGTELAALQQHWRRRPGSVLWCDTIPAHHAAPARREQDYQRPGMQAHAYPATLASRVHSLTMRGYHAACLYEGPVVWRTGVESSPSKPACH
jgi:hypothetical protein